MRNCPIRQRLNNLIKGLLSVATSSFALSLIIGMFELSRQADAEAASNEFNIAVDPASAQRGNLAKALSDARIHRRERPGDTIIINLPAELVLRSPLVLAEQDSGADSGSPLILRGPKASTRISGAKYFGAIRPNGGEVVTIPTDALGFRFSDQTWKRTSFSGSAPFPQIFQGDQRLVMSRWPKTGYALPASLNAEKIFATTTIKFADSSSFPAGETKDAWIGGFWRFPWLYENHRVQPKASLVGDVTIQEAVESPLPELKAKLVVFNLSDIREKGTCHFDYDNRELMCRLLDGGQQIALAAVESLLIAKGVSNVLIENVQFEKAYGFAVKIQDSTNFELRQVFVGHSGSGISIRGGRSVTIANSEISDVSEFGIQVEGGDRASLTPAGHLIRNTKISHFGLDVRSYRPGILISGVGITVDQCVISEAPHSGIIFRGNDHVIKNSTFHHLILDTSDAGAIYSGRDFAARGNRIVENRFSQIGWTTSTKDTYAIYLDDLMSGVEVSGNEFRDVESPIFINGGSDNIIIENKFFMKGGPAVRVEASGLTWQRKSIESGELRTSLVSTPYKNKLWSDRYPALARRELTDIGIPTGNRIFRNETVDGIELYAKDPHDYAYFR